MDEFEKEMSQAFAHLRAGRLAQARALYEKILQTDSRNPEVLHNLGVIAHKNGRSAEAVEYIEKAIRLNPQDGTYYSNLGEAYKAGGDLAKAIASYRRAIAMDPENPRAYNNLGNALKKEDRLEEAVSCLQKALALNPRYTHAHFNLGLVFFLQTQFEKAASSFRKSLKLNQQFGEAYFWLGMSLQKAGKLEAALSPLRKAIQLQPTHVEARNSLGITLNSLGRREEAIDSFSRSLEVDPKKANTLCLIGFTRIQEGKIEAAEQCFRKALKRDQSHPNAHLGVGIALQTLGEIEAAIRHFKRAYELNPKLEAARDNLMIALKFVEGEEDSPDLWEKEKTRNPNLPEPILKLGITQWKRGRLEEAADNLEKALRMNPTGFSPHYFMGLIRKAMGQFEESLKHLHEAVAREPENVYARAALASLRETQKACEKAKRQPRAKRVALQIHQKYHYAILRPLFDVLRKRNAVILTPHLNEVIAFKPEIVVQAESYAALLRPRLPEARFVWVRNGLVSKNATCYNVIVSDYACMTSEASRDWYVKHGGVPRREFWLTGYIQMDPLFRDKPLPLPLQMPENEKIILYAPTWNPLLSSAPMLGKRLPELIRSRRRNLSIIVKPHPLIFERNPDWIALWRKMAERENNFFLMEDISLDIIPLLKNADLLISDVSSVIFEYLALDRPIILISNPARYKSSYYDPKGIEWAWRDVGKEIQDIEDLPKAVARLLDHPDVGKENRARYRNLLFGNLADGRAAERIAGKINGVKIPGK